MVPRKMWAACTDQASATAAVVEHAVSFLNQLCYEYLSGAGPEPVFATVTQDAKTQNRAAKLAAASPIRRVSKELMYADVIGRQQKKRRKGARGRGPERRIRIGETNPTEQHACGRARKVAAKS